MAQNRRITKRDFYIGEHARFLVKVRDGVWHVHDAHQVSDAELRAGKLSPTVFKTKNVAEAVAFCEAHDET